jgi:hypothetical protein
MGLSDRHVALVMIAISSLAMFLSIFVMNNVRNWNTTYAVSAGIVFLLILGGLYSTTRISKPKPKS